jgi:hypothetical protein
VTASTNRHVEAKLARMVDGIDHIGHTSTLGDHCRAPVD